MSVTSVTLYDPCLERIRCMKSRQSFSRLAHSQGSRASQARIALTALRAFQKCPKTTVLQSMTRGRERRVLDEPAERRIANENSALPSPGQGQFASPAFRSGFENVHGGSQQHDL